MLVKVNEKNIECYNNLSQNYEAEFSLLTGKTPDNNGLYKITQLDKNHTGYIYYEEEKPIGFVVVHTGRERFDIEEFYVIPTHRRKGIGKFIAWQTFDLYPGSWQVRQILGADTAHKFWVSTISEYTNATFDNTTEKDPEWGTVRIQKFKTQNTT